MDVIKGIPIGNVLIINAAINTRAIFVRGPASPVMAMSFFGSLKCIGFIGTGFAAPKITGEPEMSKSTGSAMLIIGSRWGMGLRVSRPITLAVGSPSLSATTPCIISCKMAEKRRTTKGIKISMIP